MKVSGERDEKFKAEYVHTSPDYAQGCPTCNNQKVAIVEKKRAPLY
jgi:hypothetical protein